MDRGEGEEWRQWMDRVEGDEWWDDKEKMESKNKSENPRGRSRQPSRLDCCLSSRQPSRLILYRKAKVST